MPGMWPQGPRVTYTGIHFKPAWEKLRECGSLPSQQQLPQATVDHMYSHPNPRPGLENTKMVKWHGKWEVTTGIPFLKTDPIACLMGWSNKVPIIVDGWVVIVLIESGVQVSSVSSGFCEQMALKIHPLDRPLELEDTGELVIPYLDYVNVNLQIPGIRGYSDILLLFIVTITYPGKVLIMVGSKIMNRVMKGKKARLTVTWRHAHFSVVMSQSLQLPYRCAWGSGALAKRVPLHTLQPNCALGSPPG